MQTQTATLRRSRLDQETALILAAQAGDEGASAALMARYRSFVRC